MTIPATIADQVYSVLEKRTARTLPEIAQALRWKIPAFEVAEAIAELQRDSRAAYDPIHDARAVLPAWRRAG